MPNVGDELHHFGWNRCSSACHGPDRSHLIVPGFRSSRIHVLNVADDPRRPRIEKVIEPQELVEKTGYTRPHTVHCMPGDNVVVSMLGDRDGGGVGGFAVLDARTFEVKGRWENGGERPPFNYDFWYQPRKNALISSEFGEPNAYEKGFDIEDVGAGRYGQRLHFWDLAERRLEQTIDLGENGLVPLEVRWLHDPEADSGFVGATLSSNIFRFYRSNGSFRAEPVIEVDNEALDGWPLPGGVPGLITDVVLSMDDRFLYFSNWLHGDLRQYDVSDPDQPPADRPALARRAARQAERQRPRADRRTADDPAVPGRAKALRHQLALLDLGQPVLPRAPLMADASELPARGRDADRPGLLRRPRTTAPTAPRAPTRYASRAATARRRSSSDRRALRARRRPPNRGSARIPESRATRGVWGGVGDGSRPPPPVELSRQRARAPDTKGARCRADRPKQSADRRAMDRGRRTRARPRARRRATRCPR